MNNKGFTTVEVIVSFALVVIIMASMTTMLVAYRDSINVEEIKTKMTEFKNSFTYMVYTDVVSFKIDSIQPCKNLTSSICVDFYSEGVKKTELKLEADDIFTSITGEKQRRVYLNYNGIRMMLPDSDLNKYIKSDTEEKESTVSEIHDFILNSDDTNQVYSLIIPLEHKGIDYFENITIVVAK